MQLHTPSCELTLADLAHISGGGKASAARGSPTGSRSLTDGAAAGGGDEPGTASAGVGPAAVGRGARSNGSTASSGGCAGGACGI